MAKDDPQGSIPFLDIANRYVVTGSSFSPQVLQGLSRSQIAAELAEPSSAVAQAIDGAANAITAAITAVTGNQPSTRGELGSHRRHRPEAGGVTMTAHTTQRGVARQRDATRRVPAWVPVASLGLSLAAVGDLVVSHGGALHRPGRAGLSGHGDRQLRAGDDELVVGRARRPTGRPRAGVGASS